jgi:hypothetical protein
MQNEQSMYCDYFEYKYSISGFQGITTAFSKQGEPNDF